MASSIRKSQSPLSCQLCGKSNFIKWKCIDCELLMCDNCKEFNHSRFKLSKTHNVVSTKHVGKKESEIFAQFESLQIPPLVISSLFSTYTSDFPAFTQVQYSSNDTVYCSYHVNYGNKFFIIRLLKESIKVLKELDIECTDFSLGSKDEIYYGKFCASQIKVVSNVGLTETVLSTSPMVILCIHINNDNEIILGLREQGFPYPVTEFSSRKIVVFGENKKQKCVIEYDQKGIQLFSYIWRISTDTYNNIYAIDHFENSVGQIVALERYGGVKFIYKGHRSIKTSRTPFNPMGIVVTKTNIIIVCDTNNHLLHALNTKGQVIGYQAVRDLGIEYPGSLCLNSKGFLLIGCYASICENSDAKIHVAKIEL